MARKPKQPKAAEAPPPVDLAASGLQRFKMERVHRSALSKAPYNPRRLGEAEKRKLRAGLERHGMVSPVTWNKQTGNLVGGHQRIEILDALAGTDNYQLDVAVIDVDPAREKEINILLNNPNAQGDWDLEQLSALLKDSAINVEATGFDNADLYRLFGDNVLVERSGAEKLDELAQKVRTARDRYNQISQSNADKGSTDFYMVVIFRDAGQLTRFLKEAGLPDNRFQSGEEILRLCGMTQKTEQKKSPVTGATGVDGDNVANAGHALS